jgi:integral membrane protein (TIGR00529 family)
MLQMWIETLDKIPALVRMSVVFVIVLIAIRRKVSLGNAFTLGFISLATVFHLRFVETVHAVIGAVTDPKTMTLSLIIIQILVLSSSMEQSGQMQSLLGRFRGLVRNPRLNLVIFPALIGLLPMPGGAVFSAPMVKELGSDSGLPPPHLSFLNYWFRHIWEYWWPLYPGVLLAAMMANLNLAVYVIAMLPMTLAAYGLGMIPMRGFSFPKPESGSAKTPLGPFLRELLPILIVIVPGLALGWLLSALLPRVPVAKEIALIACLAFAVGWIWIERRFSADQIRRVVFDTGLLKMVYMVLAILAFKGVLTDSHAVAGISKELMYFRIPIVWVAAILPFLVGLFTGITIAFVGSTFPILISLVLSLGQGDHMLAYMAVGLVCGFSGVLLSPLHLCLLLSNEYFETPLGPVYRLLWLPCAGMFAAGLGYYVILRAITPWL